MTRRVARILGVAVVVLAARGGLAVREGLAGASSVRDTRHNLSVSGPGPIRSAEEDEICVFCHAPHVSDGATPLWNRATTGTVTYRPYESSTLASRPGQPDGSSVQCLSCHDGTIALGAVNTRTDPIRLLGGSASGRLGGGANLGTDLSGTHPVSIPYPNAARAQFAPDRATRLRADPMPLAGEGLLDSVGKVQCTSCHDPHSDPSVDGGQVPPFWRASTFSELCESCHVAPLADRGHEDTDLLPQGCGSCHVGHGVSGQPLLPKDEEEACLGCHGEPSGVEDRRQEGTLGRLAKPARIDHLFDRPFHHPVRESWRQHDPTEDLLAEGAGADRHAECVDCHDVHGLPVPAATRGVRAAGAAPSTLLGDRPEHETCYECHSSNANLPFGQTDKAAEFDPGNASFHPIEAPATGRGDAGLLHPWRDGDLIACSDCHGPDGSSGARGAVSDEPRGPHGSKNEWLLVGRYEVTDGHDESSSAYELCYSCHSRAYVLSESSFAGHPSHVISYQASCYACHDSHGSPDDPDLVRFGKDLRYSDASPSASGKLDYDPAGGGSCHVRCHGVDHDPLGYAR